MNKIIFSAFMIVACIAQANVSRVEVTNKIKSMNNEFSSTYKTDLIKQNNLVSTTVGSDSSCNFTSIQDAIDSNVEEVRVATNMIYTEQLQLNSNDISIRGGFTNCTEASNNNQSTSQSVIDYTGVNSGAIIEIVDIIQRNSIIIENFRLTGSNLGGMLIVSSNTEVVLNNVLIDNNQRPTDALGGAGIAVFTGDTDILMIDSIISNNTAGTGGGVYCSGSEASFILEGESGISQNKALGINQNIDSGKGGGLFLTNGCQVSVYSGTQNINAQTLIGISGNQANRDGGGIYASLGSGVLLSGHRSNPNGGVVYFGDDSKPVNLSNNSSDIYYPGNGSGGGAYITDADSFLIVTGGLVKDNVSSNGGAIYVQNDAILYVTRLQKNCWDSVRCNFFQSNMAKNNGNGGVIYNVFGKILITNSYFEDNQAGLGTAIYAKNGSFDDNRIDVSVFNHNSQLANGLNDKHVISLEGSGADIRHSTFADNNVEEAVIGLDFNSVVKIVTSIIHEAKGLAVSQVKNNSVVSGCMMVHNATNIPLSLVDDPEFVDRNNRDYHLNVDLSPAIDMCSDFAVSVFRDIDFNERHWDYPGIDNAFDQAPMYFSDAGADEVYDIIFKNDFE